MRKIEDQNRSIHIGNNEGQIIIGSGNSKNTAVQNKNSQNRNDVKGLREIIAQFLPLLQRSALSDMQKEEIKHLLNESFKQKEQGEVDRGTVARLNEELGRAEKSFGDASVETAYIRMITKLI